MAEIKSTPSNYAIAARAMQRSNGNVFVGDFRQRGHVGGEGDGALTISEMLRIFQEEGFDVRVAVAEFDHLTHRSEVLAEAMTEIERRVVMAKRCLEIPGPGDVPFGEVKFW